MKVTIFHNPRCSKSRETLQLLLDQGIEPEIVEYLKNPPTFSELEQILQKLDLQPRQLMRTKEAEYAELGLADESLSREDLINSMINTPKLIERPIVLANDKAAVGRPPEAVLAILTL
jgi:arsenate reductase